MRGLLLNEFLAPFRVVPGYHYTSNKTSLTFMGSSLQHWQITETPSKDVAQALKPLLKPRDLFGNLVKPPVGSMDFVMVDIHGQEVENSTMKVAVEYSVLDEAMWYRTFQVNPMPSGFYRAKFVVFGKALIQETEIF